MEEICSVCGRSMQVEAFSGKPLCHRCGNRFGITDEVSEGTYEDARALIRNLKFDEAIKILNGLDKTKPNVMVLNLLCCYQAYNTRALVDRVSSSPEAVKTLAMRKDVNAMVKSSDARIKKYMTRIFECCLYELTLAGADVSELREKLIAHKKTVKQRPSAFAQMDAEENAAAERIKMLHEAANPKEKYLDDYVNDFMNKTPTRIDRSLWDEPAGTLAGNIALDIIDLLLMDQEYSPSVMGHTRLYNAQNREAVEEEKRRERSGDFKLPDDVMRNRQRELLDMLDKDEKEILYKEENK